MYIEKCDLCGKELKRDEYLKIGYHVPFARYAFCDDCGAPVIAFLEEQHLAGAQSELIKI